MRGELRAVVGAAEDPKLRRRRTLRMSHDAAKRVTVGQTGAGNPMLQLLHLSRKILGGVRVRVQRLCGQTIGSRRAPHPKIDPARSERFEHAKLLRDLERRIMRQHDPRAPHANA